MGCGSSAQPTPPEPAEPLPEILKQELADSAAQQPEPSPAPTENTCAGGDQLAAPPETTGAVEQQEPVVLGEPQVESEAQQESAALGKPYEESEQQRVHEQELFRENKLSNRESSQYAQFATSSKAVLDAQHSALLDLDVSSASLLLLDEDLYTFSEHDSEIGETRYSNSGLDKSVSRSHKGSHSASDSLVDFGNDEDLDKLLGNLAQRDSGLLEGMTKQEQDKATWRISSGSPVDGGMSGGEDELGAEEEEFEDEEFEEEDSGFLERAASFESALERCPSLEGYRSEQTTPEELRDFDAVDENNDGVISKEEFERTHGHLPGADFDMLDADKDGGISKDEYKSFEIQDGERSPGGTLQFATNTLFESDDEELIMVDSDDSQDPESSLFG